jgi:NAD(P)-dependent dehydrogenase (short-subunit alcohol dehydrogenase family)
LKAQPHLKSRKIRVNVVSPGTVITPGYKNALGPSDEQIAQMEAEAAAATPLGRVGTPDEIAKAVAWRRSESGLPAQAVPPGGEVSP